MRVQTVAHSGFQCLLATARLTAAVNATGRALIERIPREFWPPCRLPKASRMLLFFPSMSAAAERPLPCAVVVK